MPAQGIKGNEGVLPRAARLLFQVEAVLSLLSGFADLHNAALTRTMCGACLQLYRVAEAYDKHAALAVCMIDGPTLGQTHSP